MFEVSVICSLFYVGTLEPGGNSWATTQKDPAYQLRTVIFTAPLDCNSSTSWFDKTLQNRQCENVAQSLGRLASNIKMQHSCASFFIGACIALWFTTLIILVSSDFDQTWELGRLMCNCLVKHETLGWSLCFFGSMFCQETIMSNHWQEEYDLTCMKTGTLWECLHISV